MKPARLLILAIAVIAAGMAGYLAMSLSGRETIQQIAEPLTEAVPTTEVLVTVSSVPVGSRLNADTVEWREWPENSLTEGFITKQDRPDAVTEINGAIVRLPMFAGEPVRTEKIVDSNARIMSSLLPAGKRAVAAEISVATSAGGFILPNDRVDVIMVRTSEDDSFLTEVVLENIRVLAIDQTIGEGPDGDKTAIGATATLELTPDQAQVISVVQQMADRLTLALRSVADAQSDDSQSAVHLLSGDSSSTIQVIKSGGITNVTGAK